MSHADFQVSPHPGVPVKKPWVTTEKVKVPVQELKARSAQRLDALAAAAAAAAA
jgi:hypothetical protein